MKAKRKTERKIDRGRASLTKKEDIVPASGTSLLFEDPVLISLVVKKREN